MAIESSRHFSKKELQCQCGCGVAAMDEEFLAKLEALRLEWSKPLILNSSYRCTVHNAAVGGAKGSLHVKGRAVDIRFDHSEERERFIKLAKKHSFLGIGRAHSFVHLDDRDTPTEWTYGNFSI